MPASIQLAVKLLTKPTTGHNNYQTLHPRSEILPKGWSKPGQRPLECDIKVDHDVEFVVRDGCRLYADVYRPVDTTKKVPAIISWSPYGKKFDGWSMVKHVPWTNGVRQHELSGLEKFEGIDPARWVPRDFAVVHVDSRGSGHSDGIVVLMGDQEGEDGYDVIEQLAKLPWCNGSVGMAGNSHLAIIQWHIAAKRPPALKAIAPWEGCGDLYREQFGRGGTFNLNNMGWIIKNVYRGTFGIEDYTEMYRRSPLVNTFWADKRADMSKIQIPAYITGSDFGSIHTMGAIRGFKELNTENKWIRWAAYQEWFDLWSVPETNEELMLFFDKYLKGEDNGWEKTPKVRWTTLQFGDNEPIQDIILPDFPVPNTDYRKFYFSKDNQLTTKRKANETGQASYDSSDSKANVSFTYTFQEDARLIGLPKAHLYMSCPDHEDFAICVELQKLDSKGKMMRNCNVPLDRTPFKSMSELPDSFQNGLLVFNGSTGLLRASRRYIDESKSLHPNYPFHPHDRSELVLPRGEIVELQVGIWAMGVDYRKGESLRVVITASNPTWPELQDEGLVSAEVGVNVGRHIVHFGGEYPSHVVLPFV